MQLFENINYIHNIFAAQYIDYMRKFFIATAIFTLICLIAGCSKEVDYSAYISERRTNIYTYADDEIKIQVYCIRREQPYSADGYCGELCDLVEIYAQFNRNPDEIDASVEGHSGEMSFEAVNNRYFLSFSAEAFTTENIDITLTYGGESKTYTASGALNSNVMGCEDALKCVIEYDGALFESMTKNGLFDGEIFVRLLYDEGCYYYVGVCNKDKKINAYLLDGERGKIIATKQIQG